MLNENWNIKEIMEERKERKRLHDEWLQANKLNELQQIVEVELEEIKLALDTHNNVDQVQFKMSLSYTLKEQVVIEKEAQKPKRNRHLGNHLIYELDITGRYANQRDH